MTLIQNIRGRAYLLWLSSNNPKINWRVSQIENPPSKNKPCEALAEQVNPHNIITNEGSPKQAP